MQREGDTSHTEKPLIATTLHHNTPHFHSTWVWPPLPSLILAKGTKLTTSTHDHELVLSQELRLHQTVS